MSIGIVKINGVEIDVKGGFQTVNAIRTLANFGLITFSREQEFKSTYFAFHFLKPTEELKNLYGFGNEVLVLCSTRGMGDYKSRTKDFIDYLLVTSEEFKNRLDKINVFLIDQNSDIQTIVKQDRIQDPNTRIIIPFTYYELQSTISLDQFQSRLRDFTYERDLFGIASPLNDNMLFFGKDRTNVISEFYGKYKQGEQGGLFGLRRIGKTSVLNLLGLRIEREGGYFIYFDCSLLHHNRWNNVLRIIIEDIIRKYNLNNSKEFNNRFNGSKNLTDRYSVENANINFKRDIEFLYSMLGRRILLIFDEIENLGYTTSPTEFWSKGNDSLYFWQTLRSVIQTNNLHFSFLIAGVNPKIVETGSINSYDNPIFGMFKPIYIDLFDYSDVKDMVQNIGKHIGLKFEEPFYSCMLEDFGGHPFLIRQVCSKINDKLLAKKVNRPYIVNQYTYKSNENEYKMEMVAVIEQVLSVLENYYPNEYSLLKKLALNGRKNFATEISNGETEIQHLIGYRLIDKDQDNYFIRIKSIEEYIKEKFSNQRMHKTEFDRRDSINRRRDRIEVAFRKILMANIIGKYGKKSVQYLMNTLSINIGSQQHKNIVDKTLKNALEEIYFNQISSLILKDWKSYEGFFNDKGKFNTFFEEVNKTRNIASHSKSVSDEDFAYINIVLEYFENALKQFLD